MEEDTETDFEESGADDWEGGLFQPEKEAKNAICGELIGRSRQFLARAIGFFACVFGIGCIFLSFDTRLDAVQQVGQGIFFFAIGVAVLVFATDIEIWFDKKKGQITVIEKRMFSRQAVRKYLTAQIVKVVYIPGVSHAVFARSRIQFETRDGKKFRCHTYDFSYMPKEGEFGGAKIEYRNGIWRG